MVTCRHSCPNITFYCPIEVLSIYKITPKISWNILV